MAKEVIKAWNGIICGYVHTDGIGNKKVTDERGKILGYYKKEMNITTDERGRIIARGDMATSLIPIKTKL